MTTAIHRILSQLGSFKSSLETGFVTNQGRPTASPINHLFFLPAPELKLFIATPDIWRTHHEQQQKRFFAN